jgi:FMN-dependent oxidoreductase (nitrilotriacetate monooxygenase family)
MPFQNRMMTLIAFLQAQNCSNLPGSWRHPSTMLDFLTPEYYQRIARTLEDGKIQMAFFDDRLALPDLYTGHHAEAVAAGVRAVKMDPATILMTMGMVTQRLGLGVTYSTTYYEPFHVARLFATMDLMLKGRAAWNIVTSLNRAEAANFGRDEHMGHDARYDRADEFMEVVLGHWNTWEDDALILDKANNRFADPAKVHRLDHIGRYFRSRGPFSVPRSPQGHPVLIQAGQSGRGQLFAAKWAEVVFVIYHSFEDAKREYASFKAAVAAAGRDPARVHVAPACYVCVGESEAVAQEKRAVIEATARDVDALVLLSEVLNYDFAKKPLDEPFSDEELAELSFQGFRDRVIRDSGKNNPTVGAISSLSPGAARSRSTRCFAAAHGRLPIKWRNGLQHQLVMGSCWRRRACRAPTMMWFGCWYLSCNAAGCSKRTMAARHCATIWDWRYRRPRIGTRRAARR